MAGQAPHGPWLYVAPLLAVAMIVLRNARVRRLRIETLWVAPLLFLAVVGLGFVAQPAPGPGLLAADLVALAIGAVAGWWRGRLTEIAVDPQTRRLTSRTSPIGMLLILALFAVRYGLRTLGAQGLPHVPAAQVTEVLMLLALGLVCAQRLEIALRATRLLRDARAGAES